MYNDNKQELIKLDSKKYNALYVKACVIQNGIEDSQGDTLDSVAIKKIFTSFNNQNNFEIHHNNLPLTDVSLLENYISSADESIAETLVPAGSWNVLIRVDNSEIQDSIFNDEFNGVSLNNRIKPECENRLSGQIRYQDLPDAECVLPLRISFVEDGANEVGLHVMDYSAYIHKSKQKNKHGDDKMDAKEFVGKIRDLLKDTEVEVEPKPAAAKPVIVKSNDEPQKKEPVIVKSDDPQKEEVTCKKSDEPKPDEQKDDVEGRLSKLEADIQEIKDALKKEEPKPDEPKGDEPVITKAKSNKIKATTTVEKTKNYYDLTGRDPLTGCKIR